MLFFWWEGHLTAVVTKESDNGGEEEHQDKIDWIRDLWLRTPPGNEDDFEDE
jgi:hypothetical protein